MLKKTITFQDLDGNSLTEEFYFNLSKADVIEMELSEKDGLSEYIKKIIKEEDNKKLMELFKDLIKRTIGKRSPDGRKFIQNQEITDDFMQTNAYSELLIELASNAESAAQFMNGIAPADISNQLQTAGITQPTQDVPLPAQPVVEDPRAIIERKFEDPNWIPSNQEIMGMSPDQIERAFIRKQAAGKAPQPPA